MSCELLAPAGSFEALRAAVMAGADAVYLGGKSFNARRGAANFDNDEILEAVRFCHIYGVRVHVAVNILIKENETEELAEYVRFLARAGVDAVIVQDIGAARIIKETAPSLAMHASTQLTAANAECVEFLKNAGFERVVLARELSAGDIADIKKTTGIETEIFVHGALCICYSGQCLMSSMIGGRSGNRGMCAQPCRLPYEITQKGNVKKKGYLLSPKDLCLAGEMDKIKKTGADSLKIEGRLKRPEYVAAVTGIYRKYIDDTKPLANEDKKELLDAFNRGGFTHGYFGGETGARMMAYDNPSNAAANVFSQRVHDIVSGREKRRVSVHLEAEMSVGEPLKVRLTDTDGNTAEAVSEICAELALNKPVSADELRKRLSKTGDTAYMISCADVNADGRSILPASVINSVRRVAVQKLDGMRSYIPQITQGEPEQKPVKARPERTVGISVYAHTRAQAETADALGVNRIYAKAELLQYIKNAEPVELLDDIAPDAGSADSVLIRSNGQIRPARGRKKYGGYRLNITNSYSADAYEGFELLTVSPELNINEIRQLAEKTDACLEVIVYGRLTLMLTENCPLKAAGMCQHHSDCYCLRDRKGYEFPVFCTDGCRAEILNSKPIYMADKLNDVTAAGIDSISLIFTDEDAEKTRDITKLYIAALGGKTVRKMQDNEYTRGHFFRGIT